IADAENGAVIVAAAARQIPGDWAKDPLWEELVRYPLATRLPDDRLKEADTLLKCAEPAIGEAYKLRDRPFGRYPLKYSDDFLDTKVPHLQPLREVLSALEKEALLHAFGADADKAWQACRAMINAGQTVADEPLIISQLIRMGSHESAVTEMERALSLGQANEKTLNEARALFARLEEEDLFLIAVRGERAGNHVLFTNLSNGSVGLFQMLQVARVNRQPTTLWERLNELVSGNMIRSSHIYTLRHLTRMIEAAKLPGAAAYKAQDRIQIDFL